MTLAATLLCALLSGPPAAQLPPPAPRADAPDAARALADETAALLEQHARAERERSAKPRAQRGAETPATAFWARFSALAERGSASALLWMAENARSAHPDLAPHERRAQALALHARLVERHAADPAMRDWVRRLSSAYVELPEPEVDRLVERFAELSADREAVAEALYRALAVARRSTLSDAEGRAARFLGRLEADFGDTAFGRKASGRLEVGLEVGKLAPELAATDQDGRAFRLAEYRGKVVVLDFWGFW